MKNLLKILTALLVVVSFNACEDSNNTIDEVFDYTTGAILRTISVNNATLNSSNPDSQFSVTVEEQDEQDGGLLESVDVFARIRDLTPGNGSTPASEAFVKSYDASVFTTGPVGLPRVTADVTFGEATSAMGLTPADYAPGDIYEIELRVNLTDGRTYGQSSAAGIITGGFFSSPFRYNALITCSPEPGSYQVDMQDSYGDGWQSADGILVTIDETVISVTMQSSYAGGPPCCGWTATTEFVDVPVGTETLTWNYTGDSFPGEVTFQIYGPPSAGTPLLGDFGPEPTPGLLPVTLCAL